VFVLCADTAPRGWQPASVGLLFFRLSERLTASTEDIRDDSHRFGFAHIPRIAVQLVRFFRKTLAAIIYLPCLSFQSNFQRPLQDADHNWTWVTMLCALEFWGKLKFTHRQNQDFA
jgi:hypothetical protein